MSYEGYTEHLCKNGHYEVFGCYDLVNHCRVCGADFVWENSVDETNGPWRSEIGVYYGISLRPQLKVKEVNLCKGCNQVTGNIIFYIPGEDGWVEPDKTKDPAGDSLLIQ